MNAAHLHLMLSHLPVFGFILFTPIVLYALVKKSDLLLRLSSVFIVVLSLAAIVVFNSGEGAEEIVEEIQGISHELIHEHEEAGEVSFWLICCSGFLAALVLALRISVSNRKYRFLFLLYGLLCAVSSVSAFYTAMEGGKIRHPETSQSAIDREEEDGQH